MANFVLRAYLAFRSPKVFLIVLCAFIVMSLTFHSMRGYDADFGLTNLVLSIEASVAGAVLMMVAERTAKVQDQMAKIQQEQLTALLQMAEAERQIMADHIDLLKQIQANDEKLLAALTKS
jgi:uncharacterized membrane protein